jgi:hypothetical protein
VRRSRCAIPYAPTECEVIYTHAYVHADVPNTNTRACLARIPTYLHSSAQRNSIYHTQTCPTTTHSCEQDIYCTHVSVCSVELWASAAAMCCTPFAPMELSPRLCAHVCVGRTIQRTCVGHNARSHTYNREQGHIYPCIRVCLARIPTFIPVHNAIVHTMQKCAPLLCTHASRLCTALTRVFGVWSCG